MSSPNLDVLVRALTTLLVLSLATERIAQLFKRLDVLPLSALGRLLTFPFQGERTHRLNLNTGRLEAMIANGAVPMMAPEELRSMKRCVHAENTVLIGAVLAVLSGANAFSGLIEPAASGGTWAAVRHWSEIVLTGAAAGMGSSFWYDMLGLLSEVRRGRETAASTGATVNGDSVPPYIESGTVRPPAAGQPTRVPGSS